jgi:uridine phosphorylase
MEAAALFVLGRLLGRRCGSICSVQSNRATGERRIDPEAIRVSARAASRAVAILAGWDARRERAGRRYLSASVLTGSDAAVS